MAVVRLSSKGQLVIPKAIRDALGLKRGSMCRMGIEDARLVVEPVPMDEKVEWRRWRGRIRGTGAVQAHLREHRREITRDASRA